MEQNELKKIARATKKWMKEFGAIHDYKSHQRDYMVRDEWAEAMDDIGFDVEPDDWPCIANVMFEMRIWVGLVPFKGWFLCKADDAASSLIVILNTAISMYRTAIVRMEAMERSGEFEKIAKGMPGRVRVSDFNQITAACEALGVPIGEEVKTAMEETQRLLTEAAEKHN